MKIENLRSEKNGNKARAAATVTWEDCERPAYDLFFEVDEQFSESLSCDPHAFLIGCAIPALHFGEERVFIDGEICPELRNGLLTAMTWLCHWFYEPGRRPVRIEAALRSNGSHPHPPARAGSFFSGGIDSFATLLTNRRDYPLEHPGSVKDGLLIYGLEQDDPEIFKYVLDPMKRAADALDITLIPVYTNVYLNYRQEDAGNKFKFWTYEFQSAALSAVAHALSRRLTVVSIPATDSLPEEALATNGKHPRPYGTHPVLDLNYSSLNLRIRHDGITLSRLDKTRIVADSEAALQNLRVCNNYKSYRPGLLNCGRCEKCLRTMLALEIVGVLDRTEVFQARDLHKTMSLQKELDPYYYLELLPYLRDKGLGDLAKIIERKNTIFRRHEMINYWRGKIKGVIANVSARSFSSRDARLLQPGGTGSLTAEKRTGAQ